MVQYKVKKTLVGFLPFSLAVGDLADPLQQRVSEVYIILGLGLKIYWTRSVFFYLSIPWILIIKIFIGLEGEKSNNN